MAVCPAHAHQSEDIWVVKVKYYCLLGNEVLNFFSFGGLHVDGDISHMTHNTLLYVFIATPLCVDPGNGDL